VQRAKGPGGGGGGGGGGGRGRSHQDQDRGGYSRDGPNQHANQQAPSDDAADPYAQCKLTTML
jgi:hypothetical protein